MQILACSKLTHVNTFVTETRDRLCNVELLSVATMCV